MDSQACQVASISLTGDRASNQDRLVWCAGEGLWLLALADGMGGHAAGDRAAQCLVDTASACFADARDRSDAAAFLSHVMHTAHHRVLELAVDYPNRAPPATTAVLCLVDGDRARWAHVGDSRLYHFHRGRPNRTRDHSPLEALLQSGAIDEEMARHHPLRSQVGRCIGGFAANVEPDIAAPATLAPGDVLLLCSDGFWEAFDEAELATAIVAAGDDERALRDTICSLAAQAVERGRPQADNATALALRRRKPVPL